MVALWLVDSKCGVCGYCMDGNILLHVSYA